MIWINGVLIPAPSELALGTRRLRQTDRTASGRLVINEIAIKKTVGLQYNIIAGSSLGIILTALEVSTFHTLRYPDPQGVERTITVAVEDIENSVWHTVGGERFWTGVSINFIEQ